MTCKDCVHYDFCHNNFKNIDLNEEMTDERCCVYFKDKSRFVELPKTIWVISECLELEEYEVLGAFKTNNYIWLDTKGNKQQLLMQISNYNKNWFIDKAKAEAKLKELNGNDDNEELLFNCEQALDCIDEKTCKFYDYVKTKISAKDLSKLLNISISTSYKKLSGNRTFSIFEILIIMNYLNEDLNNLYNYNWYEVN